MQKTKEIQFKDKQLQVKRLNIPHHSNQKWPVEKRIEAVTHWLALGNMRQVAALTGVSYACIRVWRDQEWWKELEAEIKASRRIVTNSKLSKIVDKALTAVEDRVENGNFFYDQKNQELVRRPISVLEATKVANDLMQRQSNLEAVSLAEVQHQSTQTIQDQLAMLAAEFAKFNKARTVNVEAKEVTDAVEREMGSDESRSESEGDFEGDGVEEGEQGEMEFLSEGEVSSEGGETDSEHGAHS